MDEEELRKRNTDCVYFLASPLTCKKGLECEYRHSEVARLNPRDCWYWLEGSCLNPSCAFRHPPLEGRTGAEPESADPHYGLTQPVNKSNVPCYFFFNKYFCKNGDRCLFLHGTDVSTHDWKSSKASSGANDVVAFEKKITTGSNTELTPVEIRPNISEITPAGSADTQHKPKRKIQQADPNNVASDGEEELSVRLDSLIPAEGFIQSRSRTVTDQSSEGHLDGLVEREEWLESSPGFDVLVGEKSENLVYEDDADYLSGLGEGGEHNLEFMRYGYDEEDIKYVAEYPEPGVEYEQQIRDSCGRLDTVSGASREGIFCRILSRKRKSLPMEPAFSGRRGVDLRDLLKKRRMVDGDDGSNFWGRNESSRLILQRRERPRRHVYNEYESMQNGVNQRSRFREAHINRQQRRTKQHLLSSEVLRKSTPRERRSTEQSGMFTGPKTLDQIKEEKKKAQENRDILGVMGHRHLHPSDAASENFQGPKPLDEILKEKRRVGRKAGI